MSVTTLNLVNSPRFHLWLQQNERVEVGFVNVTVDRKEVRAVKRAMLERRLALTEDELAGSPGDLPSLQPEGKLHSFRLTLA